MSTAPNNITAIHLVDEGVYLLQVSWGEYEADGLPVPRNGEIVVNSLDNVFQIERKSGEVLYRKDADGKTLLEIDYRDKLAELTSAAIADDDGDLQFPTLDAEFAYRKFIAQWSGVVRAEPTVTRTPIQPPISEVRVRSGDPDIVSLWNSPKVHQDQRLYRIDLDKVMVRSCVEQCGAAGLIYENSHPGYLRFAKIDGEYAFNDSFDARQRPFIGTVEQCQQAKADAIASVAEIVRVRAAKKQGFDLRNAGQVLIELRELQTALGGVRATSASEGRLASAKRALAKLVAGIDSDLPI